MTPVTRRSVSRSMSREASARIKREPSDDLEGMMGKLTTNPNHRQTRSATKSPGPRASPAPNATAPDSGRYGARRQNVIQPTKTGEGSLAATLEDETNIAERRTLVTVHESEYESPLRRGLRMLEKKGFGEKHEGGASDKGSERAASERPASEQAASERPASERAASEHGPIPRGMTEEQILAVINANNDLNWSNFILDCVLFAAWIASIILVLSMSAVFLSFITSNPTAASALSTISWPVRSVFNIPAVSIPKHGEDCDRYVREVVAWTKQQQSDFDKMRKKVESSVETSESASSAITQKHAKQESELKKRMLEAERATQQCMQRNAELTQRIDTLSLDYQKLAHQLDDIRRSHGTWRNYAVNFLSSHMGAKVIPRLTTPTARYENSLVRRLIHNILAPTNTYPAATALAPWEEAGQCWCGAGTEVSLGVALSQPAVPTTFTIEHLPASSKLDMGSQPKDVELWVHVVNGMMPAGIGGEGCKSKPPGGVGWVCVLKEQFGTFGGQMSTTEWDVVRGDYAVDQVSVGITANHGNPDRTCLYRVKLSGEALLSSAVSA
jgi:Sad1 / UNC-like C-terminal